MFAPLVASRVEQLDRACGLGVDAVGEVVAVAIATLAGEGEVFGVVGAADRSRLDMVDLRLLLWGERRWLLRGSGSIRRGSVPVRGRAGGFRAGRSRGAACGDGFGVDEGEDAIEFEDAEEFELFVFGEGEVAAFFVEGFEAELEGLAEFEQVEIADGLEVDAGFDEAGWLEHPLGVGFDGHGSERLFGGVLMLNYRRCFGCSVVSCQRGWSVSLEQYSLWQKLKVIAVSRANY